MNYAAEATSTERRRRDTLRSLVDEMMATIRAAAGQELWTPAERQRAEEDMARVMEQVRREALSDRRRD